MFIEHEFDPIDTKVSPTKGSPVLKGKRQETTTQKKNQNTLVETPTNSNTQENVNSSGHNIPLHEPKLIEQKQEKKNDMLDYTITSNVRVINKIPKGKYGYIEDYDLIKAEKFLSKRKIDVKYDNNAVYGKASSEGKSVKGKKDGAQIKREEREIPKEEVKKNIEEMIHQPYEIVKESPECEEESPKMKPRVMKKPKIVRKKDIEKIKEEKEEDDKNSCNEEKEEEKKTFKKLKDIKKKNKEKHQRNSNKNFDILFSNIQINQSQEQINPSNKNFDLLNISQNKDVNQTMSEPNKNDIFSCPNCEPVYKLSIINNIPLKVLKCLVCGNVINNTSLQFYLEKYKEELIKKNKKSKACDENGINEHWGTWVNVNKKKIKEDYIYNVLDGKIQKNQNQKELMRRDYKNTQFEDIFNRKSKSGFGYCNTKASSNKSEETLNEIEGNVKRRAKLEDFKKKLDEDVKKTEI